MGAHYRLQAWQNTGFNSKNRPLTQKVLDRFGDDFTVDDLLISRHSAFDITEVKLPGSAFTGGYDWALVDYVRIERTDGSSDAGGVGYYFVTNVIPSAAKVVTLILDLDVWTTVSDGGMTFRNGYKVRGPITSSEDENSFNLAQENIGIIEPLVVKGYQKINEAGDYNYDYIISNIDLQQYQLDAEGKIKQIEAIKASLNAKAGNTNASIPDLSKQITDAVKAALKSSKPTDDKGYDVVAGDVRSQVESIVKNGFVDFDTMVFPKIHQSLTTTFAVDYPRVFNNIKIPGTGVYLTNDIDGNVKKRLDENLSVLYSTGQLSLQGSMSIPKNYVAQTVSPSASAFITTLRSVKQTVNFSKIEEGNNSYPRKAKYLFGEYILQSNASGDINAQKIYDLNGNNVVIWSTPTPNGKPYARFANIKDRQDPFDQSVCGVNWLSKQLVFEGSSNSFYNDLNMVFQKRQNEIAKYNAAFISAHNAVSTPDFYSMRNLMNNVAQNGANFKKFLTLEQDAVNDDYARNFMQYQKDVAVSNVNDNIKRTAIQQFQNNFVKPYVDFTPDVQMAQFLSNDFSVSYINTTDKDRQRLVDYFNRYGYSGLFKKLDFGTINIKQNVNYIEAVDVDAYHEHFPVRITNRISNILENGVFLWNTKPSQSAFNNNVDN